MENLVYTFLDHFGLEYEVVKHPAVYTVEEADRYIEGKEGGRTKSLFLTNRKKTQFYLVIIEDSKRLDMNHLGLLLGTKGVRFASSESLMQKMSLTPGSVSIFGLLHNEEKDIKVYIDKTLLSYQCLTFHPNTNTKTIFVNTQDLLSLIEEIGFTYEVLSL